MHSSQNLGRARINIWELSGSHNIAEDRAKCIEDSDAAVIMVDTGDRTSIENAVNWYSMYAGSGLTCF